MKKIAMGFVLGVVVASPLSTRAAWFWTATDVARMERSAQAMYVAGAIDMLDSIAETGNANDADGGNVDSYVAMVRGCLQQRIEANGGLADFTTWAQRQWQRRDDSGAQHISLERWSGASVLLLRACQ